MTDFVRTALLPPSHVLDVFKMSGALGAAMEFEALRDMKTEDASEVRVFVEGTVRVTRLSGRIVGPGVFDRVAGQVSTDGIQVADMPAGKFRLEAMTDPAVYYCVRHRQDKRLDVKVLRLAAGKRFKVTQGQRVFVAMGACSEGAAPCLLEANTADSPMITVTDDMLGLRLTW